MGDIHSHLFLNLTTSLTSLINSAKGSPDSTADQDLITKADQFQDALERVCQRWLDNSSSFKVGSGATHEASLWHRHSRLPDWLPTRHHIQIYGFDSSSINYTNTDGRPPPIRPINLQQILDGQMPWGSKGLPAGGRPTGGQPPGGSPPRGPPPVPAPPRTPGRRTQDGRFAGSPSSWRDPQGGVGTPPRSSTSSNWRGTQAGPSRTRYIPPRSYQPPRPSRGSGS